MRTSSISKTQEEEMLNGFSFIFSSFSFPSSFFPSESFDSFWQKMTRLPASWMKWPLIQDLIRWMQSGIHYPTFRSTVIITWMIRSGSRSSDHRILINPMQCLHRRSINSSRCRILPGVGSQTGSLINIQWIPVIETLDHTEQLSCCHLISPSFHDPH